ncbi:hypothetical protein BGW37DRAFT_483330 [Umbelopsis sp. PMI_123]|nr:hypothetical protein BGW37DRAFT_483330 [Umbelopsis sp. PMI_123]
MFTAYQFTEPYLTGYTLDPFQSGYGYYTVQQELKDLYRQKLIEQERRRQAAAMEQAIIAAYERERIIRAAKELAYKQEMAERRRRQYEEYYQHQILNKFLGNLLSEENEDEEMNEDRYSFDDYEVTQCNKRARLCHNDPKPLYSRQHISPRKLHHRRKYQQPQDEHQVWLLVQHLKDVDESEAVQASRSTEAPAKKDKGKGKATEQSINVNKETSSQATSNNEDHPEEDDTPVDVDSVLENLRAIGKKLDYIQEEHESTVLATPLTFDTESEDLSRQNTPNKEFLTYEDDIMKVLLELDAVESHGLEEIRNQRKVLVARSENLLKIIDEYKQKEWERASTSSVTESETDADKDMNESTPIDTTVDQAEPMEMEAQEITSSDDQITENNDIRRDSPMEGSTPVAAETTETSSSMPSDTMDKDIQVDTTDEVIVEHAAPAIEKVTEEVSEVTEDAIEVTESEETVQQEDLDFEKVEHTISAANEQSSPTTNAVHVTVTDEDDDFEMVDDQDVPSQSTPEVDPRPSSPKQTSSKPLQIPIEWTDN